MPATLPLADRTIAEVGELLRRREVSSRELTEVCLGRIGRVVGQRPPHHHHRAASRAAFPSANVRVLRPSQRPQADLHPAKHQQRHARSPGKQERLHPATGNRDRKGSGVVGHGHHCRLLGSAHDQPR